MHMLHPNFVIIGTIISAIGTISYIIETVKGTVKPNRVSFLLWSIAPLIAFAAMSQQGVGISSLMTFSTGFLPLLVFIASFVNKNAVWALTRFDVICGVLSVVGLVLWYITQVGTIAIIFSIIADGLAAIPTIRKAYSHPETEIAWPWLATAIGVIITLLTLQSWTFADWGFMSYILLVSVTMYLLVRFRPRSHRSTPHNRRAS